MPCSPLLSGEKLVTWLAEHKMGREAANTTAYWLLDVLEAGMPPGMRGRNNKARKQTRELGMY